MTEQNTLINQSTDTISAADNHVIQMTDNRWRLIYKNRPLAEATPQGFRYGGRFGNSRRLNDTNLLTPDTMTQVVLGWQQSDEAWHLGLILNQALADERGSRWCELVHWPDPDANIFEELAIESGQQLAQVMGVPFYQIPPQTQRSVAPPRELVAPPLDLGLWSLEQVSNDHRRYVLNRSSEWAHRKIGRITWYAFWMLIYIVLSIATLTADIALPNAGTILQNPQWLPYLGLGSAVLLLGLIIYHLWIYQREPDRIYIDGVTGGVSAWRGDTMRWEVSKHDIQSVYVSEQVRSKEAAPATEYGELNLHLGGGNFRFLVQQEEAHENRDIPVPNIPINRKKAEIRPLTRDEAHTALQIAGVYIAEAMGDIPAWYDMRIKSSFL